MRCERNARHRPRPQVALLGLHDSDQNRLPKLRESAERTGVVPGNAALRRDFWHVWAVSRLA